MEPTALRTRRRPARPALSPEGLGLAAQLPDQGRPARFIGQAASDPDGDGLDRLAQFDPLEHLAE
jgi:hypothetical protein